MTNGQRKQSNSTSTVLGRRLGRELVRLRTSAGLTQGAAASAITATTGKVAKMEGGWVPVRSPDLRALCELYGATDLSEVGALLELARVDRERRKASGWWSRQPEVGVMAEYIGLEAGAVSMRTWQLTLVPGLLQTPGYATAVCAAGAHAVRADVETLVRTREARQVRLTEQPGLELDVVLYEAVLRQQIGDAATMRAQLRHLIEMAGRPNVRLRVLPFSAGAFHGMNCTFNILSFAEPGALDVVYMEVPFRQMWWEGDEDAERYSELYSSLGQRVLDERESVELLRELAGEE